ncbi:DUF4190 domain-containing protein [Arthrobacter sp. Y-9]|uniref:DUF4190 domain-containing protein n=1 Tax=Arthrobacter sp. Y-9 TaxID=3039385 RepID=UPI00241DD886|nr:DUF4190 domain-containing protein [Arthrobacter sp. Y-9]WFR83565.1 DUF4190 domain-containing protein [Arthrobacter sp. Y-9]
MPQYGGPPPAPSGSKGLAIASLVCGAVSLFLAWVPAITVLALIAGLAAIVLGVVSLARRFGGKVMAWIGTGLGVLGVLGSVLALIVFATLSSSGLERLKKFDEGQDRRVSVKYIVTTSTSTNVSFSTPTGDSEKTVSSDFTTEFTAQGKDLLDMTATPADRTAKDAKVTCEILVDGTSVAKESGDGKNAGAHCYHYRSYSSYRSEKPSKDVSVEFKATANSPVSVESGWSASGGQNSSSRTFAASTDSTTTVQAKADGLITLTVQSEDWEAKNPSFGCEILVDGKSVSKQQSNKATGFARCVYTPQN